MRLAYLVLVLVACGPQPPPAPLSGRAAPPPPAAGPPPAVAWIDNGFDVSQLPAVSHDGSVIVLAIRDSDGGRGNPNLRIVQRDRRDADIAKPHVVLDANDADAMFDASGMSPQLRDRIATANRWLAELHAAQHLVPLARLAIETSSTGLEDQHRASGGGVTVTWRASRLAIARDGKVLVDRATPRTWLVDDKPMYTGAAEICSNPAFLESATVDVARSVALVTVAYTGTDTCWEPAAAPHVVAW